jgi:hypothetical protein
MLIRRPPSMVFNLFRTQLLDTFRQWITDSRPTRSEIEEEIATRLSAMKQIAEIV